MEPVTARSPGARRQVLLWISLVSSVLWFILSVLSDTGEAWDESAYWFVAVPVLLVLCGLGGRLLSGDVGIIAIAAAGPQAILLAITADEGGLIAVGVILLLFMTGLFALAAIVGRFSNRLTRRHPRGEDSTSSG